MTFPKSVFLFYTSTLPYTLSKIAGQQCNTILVASAMRKYKRYAGRKIQAGRMIGSIAINRPRLFVHWRQGKVGAFALWERCEVRASRTVLRELRLVSALKSAV